MRQIVSLMLVFGGLAVGCADEGDGATDVDQSARAQLTDAGAGKSDASVGCVGDATASSSIEPRAGNTTLKGTLLIAKAAGTTKLTVKLTGAPPGEHAAHIHMTGDCSAADATSAGGHWNPAMSSHGKPGATAHLGDLGNFTVAADGSATLEISNPAWTIGDGATTDVVGKAIVIHGAPDDFVTQPTGNAGARIGCGVIKKD
jgi:superoxide dismutase, Cu-Zn family